MGATLYLDTTAAMDFTLRQSKEAAWMANPETVAPLSPFVAAECEHIVRFLFTALQEVGRELDVDQQLAMLQENAQRFRAGFNDLLQEWCDRLGRIWIVDKGRMSKPIQLHAAMQSALMRLAALQHSLLHVHPAEEPRKHSGEESIHCEWPDSLHGLRCQRDTATPGEGHPSCCPLREMLAPFQAGPRWEQLLAALRPLTQDFAESAALKNCLCELKQRQLRSNDPQESSFLAKVITMSETVFATLLVYLEYPEDGEIRVAMKDRFGALQYLYESQLPRGSTPSMTRHSPRVTLSDRICELKRDGAILSGVGKDRSASGFGVYVPVAPIAPRVLPRPNEVWQLQLTHEASSFSTKVARCPTKDDPDSPAGWFGLALS